MLKNGIQIFTIFAAILYCYQVCVEKEWRTVLRGLFLTQNLMSSGFDKSFMMKKLSRISYQKVSLLILLRCKLV